MQLKTDTDINMDSFFDIGLFKELAELINEAFGRQIISPRATAIITLIAFIIVILYFVIIKPISKNHKWRRKQLDEILRGYGNYTRWWQRWLYIDTVLQTDPPHDLDEPYQAQFQDLRTNTNAIDFFLKQVLRRDNTYSPYYCILGGSGMGKSTFVVNLVWKYINKYKDKTLPYPVKLINCRDAAELTESIKEIDNKENTILIMDALDENNEAIDNYREFYRKLLNSITKFRIVIITCRTQFFEKYEDEPKTLPGNEPSTKKPREFKKYYVSPFKTEEVSHYLNKKYLLRFKARKKSKIIANNCTQLMARPLLLSYIDDLSTADIGNHIDSIAQIYEIIIDKWLEREAFFAASYNKKDEYKKALLEFSSEIALSMVQTNYDNNSTNIIIERYKDKPLIKTKNLKGRSLLNRNSKSDLKFAHKSFMEYLVAKQLFEQKDIQLESIDCVSNDMIPKFLYYMMVSLMREEECGGINISLSTNAKFTLDGRFNFTIRGIRGRLPNILNGNSIIKSQHFTLNCDVSENIAKIISTFIRSAISINQDKADSMYILLETIGIS